MIVNASGRIVRGSLVLKIDLGSFNGGPISEGRMDLIEFSGDFPGAIKPLIEIVTSIDVNGVWNGRAGPPHFLIGRNHLE